MGQRVTAWTLFAFEVVVTAWIATIAYFSSDHSAGIVAGACVVCLAIEIPLLRRM